MPSLIQGRIVYCTVGVCDPQGNNPKPNRPFVVITHDDDIKTHERIQAVGITDELGLSPADHYHELPSGSGCSPGSAVLCTWIVRLNKADLDVKSGFLKPKHVYEIIEKVKRLRPGEFTSRAPGEKPPPT